MVKYGVCNCDLDAYDPIVSNLEVFITYGEAFNRYITRAMENEDFGYVWDKMLWYVWIEDGKII